MARKFNGILFEDGIFYALNEDFGTWEKIISEELKGQLLEDIQKIKVNFSKLTDQMNMNLRRNYGMSGAVNYSGADLEVKSTKYGESVYNVLREDIKKKEEVENIDIHYDQLKINQSVKVDHKKINHPIKSNSEKINQSIKSNIKKIKLPEKVKRKNFFFCKKMKFNLKKTIKLFKDNFCIKIKKSLEDRNREMVEEFYLN